VHPRVRLLMFIVSMGALVTACATSQSPASAQPSPDLGARAVLPVDVARDSFRDTSELVAQVITQINNCTGTDLTPCHQAALRSIERTGRVRAALTIAGSSKTTIANALNESLDRIGDSSVNIITKCMPETFSGTVCQDSINSLRYDLGGLMYNTNNAVALDH
jgi:hypothetical protein